MTGSSRLLVLVFIFMFGAPAFAEPDKPNPCPFPKIASASQKQSLFRRSPLKILVGTALHVRDLALGRDPYRGHPQPVKMGPIKFLSLYLRHLFNPVRVLEEVHQKYGDEVLVQFLSGDRLVFQTDHDVIKEVLKQTDARGGTEGNFEKSDWHSGGMGRTMGYAGVFLGKGPIWKNARGLLQPDFTPAVTNTEANFAKYGGIVDRHVNFLKEQIAHSPDGAAQVDFRKFMNSVTLDFVLTSMFSKQLDHPRLLQLGDDFKNVLDWITLETFNPLQVSLAKMPIAFSASHRKMQQSYQRISDLAAEIIRERRANPDFEGKDVLSRLLSAPIPEEALHYEIMTMLLAGHDTTATSLTWAFHLMGNNQKAQGQLKMEVDSVKGQPLTSNTLLNEMPFLDHVFNETLRLYPPGYFYVRTAKVDTTIKNSKGEDVFIPKDAEVILQYYVAQRKSSQWDRTGYPAAEFAPERWSAENRQKLGLTDKDFENYAFGFGPRICLAKPMATAELKLVLARMYQEFDIEPVNPGPGIMTSDLAIKLKGGYPVRVRPRAGKTKG